VSQRLSLVAYIADDTLRRAGGQPEGYGVQG